jgi:hypothetical protein
MSDVLIRDVPTDDLDEIRAAALARGMSLQAYLRDTVHAQAVHLRRQAALAGLAERLEGRPEVPDDERRAVLGAIDDAHQDRIDQLISRPTP